MIDLGRVGVWAAGLRFAEPAQKRIPVATGIVNIWVEDATDVAAQTAKVEIAHPDRLLLGVGVSHGPVVGARYGHPLRAMREYLDRLDSAPTPVQLERRIVAAIGERMLGLARERACGSHPYLMPPEHTHLARQTLGAIFAACWDSTRLTSPTAAVTGSSTPPSPGEMKERSESGFALTCKPVQITSACRSRRRGNTCPAPSCVASRRRLKI